MKLERITYQKIFPLGAFANERLGMEAILDDAEDPKQAMKVLKKLVHEMHLPEELPQSRDAEGIMQIDQRQLRTYLENATSLQDMKLLKPHLPEELKGEYAQKLKKMLLYAAESGD